MFAKTLQKLIVPEEKNTIFVSPEYSSWAQLLLDNKLAVQNLPNLPESRKELLNIAKHYTRTVTGTYYFDESPENIIVTGHQASWHHCGILAKNSITSRFATDVDGCGIHLVLDHDITDTAMLLPKSGSDGRWYFERIQIEREQTPLPLEFRAVPQIEKIQALINNIAQAKHSVFGAAARSQSVRFEPGQVQAFKNIADFITSFQAMLNTAVGIHLMYLPVSLFSQSDAFTNFTASIIENAEHFARTYNNAVSQQLKIKKIKPKQTIRPLAVDSSSGLTELPFWLLSPEGGRESLYVTPDKANKIKISTALDELGNLDSACPGGKTEQLKNMLNQLDYRLRPKAVSLTLFARLFLGDWFVHGIGGALYEPVTDYIIENYYRIKSLKFGVSTATVTLPAPDNMDDSPETISELKQQLRSLKYNPENFIEKALCQREPAKSLIETKDKLVSTTKDRNLSAQVKKSAWESIAEINKKLLKYAEKSRQILERKIKLSENQELSKQVLNYREYFFGLFPEDKLRKLVESPAFTKM